MLMNKQIVLQALNALLKDADLEEVAAKSIRPHTKQELEDFLANKTDTDNQELRTWLGDLSGWLYQLPKWEMREAWMKPYLAILDQQIDASWGH